MVLGTGGNRFGPLSRHGLGDKADRWAPIFDGAHEKSHHLALQFEIMADSLGVHFFDAGSVCECDPGDGFHIGADAHEALGLALADEIKAIGWIG